MGLIVPAIETPRGREVASDLPRTRTWYGRRYGSYTSWGIAALIALASIRGIIVLNTALSPSTVYQSTAACLIMLSVYGFVVRKQTRHAGLRPLKRLLQLNLLLGIVNIVIELMLGQRIDPSVLYVYMAPYAIFILMRVPVRYLYSTIAVVAVAISYSVADNFVQLLSGPEGLERVSDYNARLRPDVFQALSRTGDFYRTGGYTGSYHDSANILGMVVCFLFIRFLQEKKILDLVLFLVSVVCMTLTQSAANILVAIFVLTIFSVYALVRSRRATTLAYLFVGVAALGAAAAKLGSAMGIFTARVGGEGDWGGILISLDANTLLAATPYVIIGHAGAFGSRIQLTEIGLLKELFQIGIIHAVILYWMSLYPVFYFWKSRARPLVALPAAAAVSFGFLSLIHYGSLHRVTNVFLFYAFYAMCLVAVLNSEPPRPHAVELPRPIE